MRMRLFIYGRMAFAALAVLLFPGAVYTLDFKLLLLPSLLMAYYFAVWLVAGQGPKPGVIVPQYAAPGNMSPAEMRYLVTGSADRKTVAAILAHLASQKLITVEPEGDAYRIMRVMSPPPANLPPEEASALDALAELESFPENQDRTLAAGAQPVLLLRPTQGKSLSLVASVVMGSLSKRVGGQYFKRNLQYTLPAVAVSIAAALIVAANVGRHGDAVFITLWFLLFSLGIGVVVVTNVARALRDAVRGMLSPKNIALTIVPLPLFLGIPAAVDVMIARNSSPMFAWVLAALVVVNIAGGLLVQTLTPLGRERMDQVAGFKQFLASVELDRINRMNNPHLTPALLNDYLAYAIALDLKEAWGDHLANALFATTTSAG
jgi:hypothetical protein